MNISWSSDENHSTVSYYEMYLYYLDRKLSASDPDSDVFIGLSLPQLSISSSMEAGYGPDEFEYHMLTKEVSVGIFIKTSVSQYIWGYADEVLKSCNDLPIPKCPSIFSGLMFGRNGTVEGPFTIDTGAKNIQNVGKTIRYRGDDKMDIWLSEDANFINGTDGTRFSPGLRTDAKVDQFSAEECRSFSLKVDSMSSLKKWEEMKVLKLSTDLSKNEYIFGSTSKKSTGPNTLPRGLSHLSSCRTEHSLDPPLYSSQPRYFDADASLVETIDGITKCDKATCDTQILVEPKTGIVLESHWRRQISIYVNPTKLMKDLFKNFTRQTFFPLFWYEENFVQNSSMLSILHEILYTKPFRILVTIAIVLAVILLNLLVVSIVLFSRFWSMKGSKQYPPKLSIVNSPWGVPHLPYYANVLDKKSTEIIN